MKNSYLVTIGIGVWLESCTVLVDDLKGLVNLIGLTEDTEEYKILRIDTLSINQDYSELVQEIIKSKKPNDMNFGKTNKED